MKTTSLKIEHAVKELLRVRGELKAMSLRESDLKDQIRAHMGDNRLLETYEACVLVETRTRTDLDKGALMHDLGFEKFKKYQKQTQYEIFTVKSLLQKRLGG